MAVPHCFSEAWARDARKMRHINSTRRRISTYKNSRIKLPNKSIETGTLVKFSEGVGKVVDSYEKDGETIYRLQKDVCRVVGDGMVTEYQYYWRRGACLKEVDNEL